MVSFTLPLSVVFLSICGVGGLGGGWGLGKAPARYTHNLVGHATISAGPTNRLRPGAYIRGGAGSDEGEDDDITEVSSPPIIDDDEGGNNAGDDGGLVDSDTGDNHQDGPGDGDSDSPSDKDENENVNVAYNDVDAAASETANSDARTSDTTTTTSGGEEVRESSQGSGDGDDAVRSNSSPATATATATSPATIHANLASSNLLQLYHSSLLTLRSSLLSLSSRSSRGHPIENFGDKARDILTRTVQRFERATLKAAFQGNGGEKGDISDGDSDSGANKEKERKTLRGQLYEEAKDALTALHEKQMELLKKDTLRRFRRDLHRQSRRLSSKSAQSATASAPAEDSNTASALLRGQAFRFTETASGMEVKELGLTCSQYAEDVVSEMSRILESWEESDERRVQALEETARQAKKQPKSQGKGERAVNFGVNLVAMLRPDGFGSLQGYGGYNKGMHGVTVGICNDADSPEIINQMGGMRPPWIRVQPQLTVDIDL